VREEEEKRKSRRFEAKMLIRRKTELYKGGEMLPEIERGGSSIETLWNGVSHHCKRGVAVNLQKKAQAGKLGLPFFQ